MQIINKEKPEITIPASGLLLALDYLEFLNQSWKCSDRRNWGFIQPEARFNLHGFSAAKAKDILERFRLCWVPFHDTGFAAAYIQQIVRSARSQGHDFLVPVRDLVVDIASNTYTFSLAPPVFKREQFGDPNAYRYEVELMRFFSALAIGDVPRELLYLNP